MDTGGVVRGRLLDIYMRNCDEAIRFGRRSVQVFVLRLGWNPRATGPSLLDTLLPWRDHLKPRAAKASRPPPEVIHRPAAVPEQVDGSAFGSGLAAGDCGRPRRGRRGPGRREGRL